MTFLTRHRTICAVIQEIREGAVKAGDEATVSLCDEARTYAERMSAKLVENKKKIADLRKYEDEVLWRQSQ